MKNLTILTATLGAIVIGAALGVLFAPYKGSKTRDKITIKSREYSDQLLESIDDFADTVSNSFENIGAKTKQLAKQGKSEAMKVAADLNSKMH
jgi:gas vesicle protein